MPKIHMEDIRLANNSGMTFPVCAAQEKLLDLDKAHWKIVDDINNVTCQHCLRMFPKRYPWARKAKKS